jgi:hypothetical protein
MKSSRHGENILVSVENITPFGICFFVICEEESHPAGIENMWEAGLHFAGNSCKNP